MKLGAEKETSDSSDLASVGPSLLPKAMNVLWALVTFAAAADCDGDRLCQGVLADGQVPADSLLQHASHASHAKQNKTNTSDVNDAPFNPFDPFASIMPSADTLGSGSGGASSFAGVMLGTNRGTMQSCGDFLQQVMSTAFKDPQKAMQSITALMTSTDNSMESIKCLKMALDYADQLVVPEECKLQNGQLNPSCCVSEKRCSSTNPMDGCPTFVFPPKNIFDPSSSDVQCVGSHEMSPVATGMCMCKNNMACVKEKNQNSKCM